MKRSYRRKLSLFIVCVFFIATFFSCSYEAERKSFISDLDGIDALISQGLYKDACEELQKIEKKAFSSWAELGIFKRYIQISEDQRAEKLIQKALKKNPENLELSAVYTNFLNKNNRIEDALVVGKILEGTKYGSIYSESVLRDTINKYQKDEFSTIFLRPEYYSVYYDAYIGSKKDEWLRNCAVMNLLQGNYSKAAEIHPEQSYDVSDAYFWSLVLFDSARYGDSIYFSDVALHLYELASKRVQKNISVSDIISVKADSYSLLSDSLKSEESRRFYIESLKKDKFNNYILTESEINSLAVPVLFVNSANWSKDNNEYERAEKLLTFIVDTWPDFVPGLTAYVDFAYETNLEREEDFTELSLRDFGLATLEMEQYDNRIKIPLSDAMYRVSESIKRTKDPLLYLLQLDLNYKISSNMSEKEKISDMWIVLEKNMISPGIYPEILVRYAINFLCMQTEVNQSCSLFKKYLSNKYSVAIDSDFWSNVINVINMLSQWELEYCAYFSIFDKQVDEILCFHEYSVFENSTSNELKHISPAVSDTTCINLALIYDSLGDSSKAMDLYSKTMGRISNLKLKSLIMYRIALHYYNKNDMKNALHSAEYAVSLNQKNVQAKFLITKINSSK